MPANRKTEAWRGPWLKNNDLERKLPETLKHDGDYLETYVPKNVEDCATFILTTLGLPEIEAYDDETGVKSALAADLAAKVYAPDEPVVPAIERLLAEQASAETAQDIEHRRLVALARAEREIALRNNPELAAEPAHLATISVLNADGELSIWQKPAADVRSFG